MRTAYSNCHSYTHGHTQIHTCSGTGKEMEDRQKWQILFKGGNEETDSKLCELLNAH